MPNFALGTIPMKRPNKSRRISVEFRTRDVSDETAEVCIRGRF
ncbi:MAG: hypothetical protein Q8881_03235 [Sweet potato little leaf phytoplasma]|nr:hypothetical protein [Sweet potato little leaf phytoplasma]